MYRRFEESARRTLMPRPVAGVWHLDSAKPLATPKSAAVALCFQDARVAAHLPPRDRAAQPRQRHSLLALLDNRRSASLEGFASRGARPPYFGVAAGFGEQKVTGLSTRDPRFLRRRLIQREHGLLRVLQDDESSAVRNRIWTDHDVRAEALRPGE